MGRYIKDFFLSFLHESNSVKINRPSCELDPISDYYSYMGDRHYLESNSDSHYMEAQKTLSQKNRTIDGIFKKLDGHDYFNKRNLAFKSDTDK